MIVSKQFYNFLFDDAEIIGHFNLNLSLLFSLTKNTFYSAKGDVFYFLSQLSL